MTFSAIYRMMKTWQGAYGSTKEILVSYLDLRRAAET